MKTKLSKKLNLNKNKISRLNDHDMNLIRGATLVMHCSESCSLVKICCEPTVKEYLIDQNLEKNPG